MPYFLALLSAVFYGAADFLGGLASRRTHSYAVVVVSGYAGLALLGVLLPFLPAALPTSRDLIWGAAAGLAGGIGVGLLYRALSLGRMSVIAPTTALCAVAIPALAGLARGERPSPVTLAGMALALVAIVMVSRPEHGSEHGDPGTGPGDQETGIGDRGSATAGRKGLGLAFLSGVAIGLFYLAIAETSPAAGLWPLLPARAASVVLFGGLAVAGGHSLRVSRPALWTVVAIGALDMLANVLYVLATRGGPLSVIVTLSALYPASTVVLARLVLGERLSLWQSAGVTCALIAVVLIVGGW